MDLNSIDVEFSGFFNRIDVEVLKTASAE